MAMSNNKNSIASSDNADKFSNHQYWQIITPPIKALFETLKNIPEIKWQKWLDLGCGAGMCFTHFPTTCQVCGVDFSPALLTHARANIRKNHLKNIKLINQDINQLDLKEKRFDGAMLFQCYPHLNYEVLIIISRFLNLNGWLVIAYGAEIEVIEAKHHQHPELTNRPIPLGLHMKMDFTNGGFKFEEEWKLSPQEVSDKAKMESERPLIAFLGRKII